MAKSTSLPLYEKVSCKNILKRAVHVVMLFLLLSLLIYRLFSLNKHGLPWILAFLCELWFTMYWLIIISTKWSPFQYITYPHHLLQRMSNDEFPAVDMFVTTADPELEPPILTINTVLSLLAVDYPSKKLACYVSDDACSSLIFYSLIEASKFAKFWVPFCKKYNVRLRAPFRYFSMEYSLPSDLDDSIEFQRDWKAMKDMYEQLNHKIDDAVAQKYSLPCDLSGDFAAFSNIQRNDHPTIIKVISENKEGLSDGVPHLVYISREKRPKQPHRYKAGAMNVLIRVSGLITNAPIMMNVDCDMYANNPKVILHALCLLLEPKNQREVAFVQCPQVFYDALKDDPFGNQLTTMFEYVGKGMSEIQGPFYGGTGCFHRRKVIYGLSPDDIELCEKTVEDLLESFGNSKELRIAASRALKEKVEPVECNLGKCTEAAYQVAGCGYEYGTNWGVKVGLMYGSATEDVLTGLTIHNRGWRSVLCTPEPPAFMGCAPTGGPASATQMKRWSTGLLEIFFTRHCPLLSSLFAKLCFRQCLAYLWISLWAFRSVGELCYAALTAYCLLTNSYFLPKVKEPAFYIPIALLSLHILDSMSEYVGTKQSIRAWWNSQRTARIYAMGAWFFGLLSVVLKLLRISETVFEVTQKDQSTSNNGSDQNDHVDASRYTFDESPAFVLVTTLLLLHLTSLAMFMMGLQPPAIGRNGSGILEVISSVWLVLSFSPFLKGLFGKGKYGIPMVTMYKSTALALLFVLFCRSTTII